MEFQRAGKLQMLGIIQEQDADRCRLFMQWRRMDWPVLVDTFNLLEVSVVPLTYAIDEHGIVRLAGLRRGDVATLEARFLNRRWPAPEAATPPPATVPEAERQLREIVARAAGGAPEAVEEAIEVYGAQVRRDPEDGWGHFRLAVAYRLRHDSPQREPGDFQRAVDHWQTALDRDPNNYIWRRRIQQYGPRLAKPYPFYDWVETARTEIRARGEKPVPLRSEPTGSEIATPKRDLQTDTGDTPDPDPQGRVRRDGTGGEGGVLIHAEVAAVPRTLQPGSATRAHLLFRPHHLAHWNNENEPLRVWIEPPPGWRVDRRLLSAPVPDAPQATSTESRSLEVELRVPEAARPGPVEVPAYALYYVCEDRRGACLYRRQDLTIHLDIRSR